VTTPRMVSVPNACAEAMPVGASVTAPRPTVGVPSASAELTPVGRRVLAEGPLGRSGSM
jgi:hypothetical protein